MSAEEDGGGGGGGGGSGGRREWRPGEWRTILEEWAYSVAGAVAKDRGGEVEDWRGEEAARARREELREWRLRKGREKSEGRWEGQRRAMRKEDGRWELERERRRMEEQDERLWKLEMMKDKEVEEERRQKEEEWSVEKWRRRGGEGEGEREADDGKAAGD